jgi:hypothetical protein
MVHVANQGYNLRPAPIPASAARTCGFPSACDQCASVRIEYFRQLAYDQHAQSIAGASGHDCILVLGAVATLNVNELRNCSAFDVSGSLFSWSRFMQS